MRKLIVLPMAILMCVFMVTPAFAFTSNSFVIDTDDYLFESIHSSSFSLRNSASSSSVDSSGSSVDVDFDYFLNNASCTLNASVAGVTYSGVGINGSLTTVETPFVKEYSGTLPSYHFTDSGRPAYSWYGGVFSWSPDPDDHYRSAKVMVTSVSLSLSGVAFDSISFSGGLNPISQIWGYDGSSSFSDCSIYVNGSKVASFVPDKDGFFQFNDFIYSSSSSVSSVELVFTGGFIVDLPITDHLPASFDGNTFQLLIMPWHNRQFSFSTLTDDGILNGYNDNAQDAMNQQGAIESQWTGSMTENFNKLSLSNFSFPDAAVTGFTLISGIFNDLWNAMGDFRIVYVFPLTLGVVLLLIGRLSRTSVKRSSGRGDDDA